MSWKEKKRSLEKEFRFRNFRQALEFINRVGGVCENEAQYPEIYLHQKSKVLITIFSKSLPISEEVKNLSKFIDKVKKS